MHNSATCPDPTCSPCLDLSRQESVARLELVLLDAEIASPSGEYVDSQVMVDWLDVRNVLDLLRGV